MSVRNENKFKYPATMQINRNEICDKTRRRMNLGKIMNSVVIVTRRHRRRSRWDNRHGMTAISDMSVVMKNENTL
jgi:hypothetical protein